ncbi:MAG: hypothetical protein HZA16_04340 [Nitrospirae bacterium]|nr:hypothetical protein [Nitrospirota bacterium]
MNKKSFVLNVVVLCLSIILSFIVIEIIWRIILFSDIEIFAKQRLPELYADEYADDDFWKLRFQLNKKEYLPLFNKAMKANRYQARQINRYIDGNFKHIDVEHLNNRRPVLMYGDSFVACYSQDDCFDHILNNDTAFSRNHYLLNYGVGGYGLDQIYLLLKNSVDNYDKPFVVLSFMTLDLDRSCLSFREDPKPFFTIENDVLKLHEKPVYSTAESLFSNNKPQITSYFYRRVIYSKVAKKLMPDKLISYLRRETYFREKTKEINEKIMLEIIKELKSRNLNYVFLVFHPNWIRGTGPIKDNPIDWRDTIIKQILTEHKIPYIWSKDIIFQQMKNGKSVADLFVDDGHPTGYQRTILSEKIKEAVLNSNKNNEADKNADF